MSRYKLGTLLLKCISLRMRLNSIPHKIWVVRTILHYLANFIEADRIKIVIINPDVPLLADGRQFAMGMTV